MPDSFREALEKSLVTNLKDIVPREVVQEVMAYRAFSWNQVSLAVKDLIRTVFLSSWEQEGQQLTSDQFTASLKEANEILKTNLFPTAQAKEPLEQSLRRSLMKPSQLASQHRRKPLKIAAAAAVAEEAPAEEQPPAEPAVHDSDPYEGETEGEDVQEPVQEPEQESEDSGPVPVPSTSAAFYIRSRSSSTSSDSSIVRPPSKRPRLLFPPTLCEAVKPPERFTSTDPSQPEMVCTSPDAPVPIAAARNQVQTRLKSYFRRWIRSKTKGQDKKAVSQVLEILEPWFLYLETERITTELRLTNDSSFLQDDPQVYPTLPDLPPDSPTQSSSS